MREDLRLLRGAIDTHIHASPSLFPRVCDHVECARRAAEVGMRAVVFKVHHGDTSGRVPLVRDAVGDAIEVYGGVTLNNAVGGFNPFAVDTAIRLGAKTVWMPTLSAKNHLEKLGAPHFPGMKQVGGVRLKEKPLTVFADERRRRVLPEVRTICKLIGQAGICLSTGHLDPGEVKALIEVAKEEGVKHIIVQHPEYIVDATIEEQRAFARMGAYIEHLAIFCFTHWGAYPTNKKAPPISAKEQAKMVRAVGPARTILSTDLGQLHNAPPWEGMRMFAQLMLENGIKPAELETMLHRNPAKVMGLPVRPKAAGAVQAPPARRAQKRSSTPGDAPARHLSPAQYVIEAFGGAAPLARELGYPDGTRVWRWQQPKAEGGQDGQIPDLCHRRILDLARERGLDITPEDLIAGREVAKETR